MMRHKAGLMLFIVVLLFNSGCAAMAETPAVKARLVGLSSAQKTSIEAVISDWFGGVAVSLADNAFMQSSTLTIERKAHTDSRGLPIEGRHNNPAMSMTLLKQGDRCLLQNNASAEQVVLKRMACIAEE